MASVSSPPRTVEEIFKDYSARRSALLRALTMSSVPLVLNPSRGSEIEFNPYKASEDEDWLGSDVSSPKDTPLCLDYVPYEQRAAMEAEREGNPISEPSSFPEKEDWEAKWDDDDCRWGRWNHMSQRKTNGFFMDTKREGKSISIFDMNGPEEEEPAPRCPRWEQRPPWPYHRENRIRIIESTGVGAGLKNLGNTCFINAILQCFTHTVPLVLGLRSSDHEKPCARHKEGFCMLCALSPSIFFENLNPLHIFHHFSKNTSKKMHMSSYNACWIDLKAVVHSQIQKTICSNELFQLRCCNCGHCSETYEPLVDFSLD